MITASVRLKPSETNDQLGLFGAEVPVEKLRVDKTLPNTAARECGLTVFENWRVPEQSAIQSLFFRRCPHDGQRGRVLVMVGYQQRHPPTSDEDPDRSKTLRY
jgi:hypothetical protein